MKNNHGVRLLILALLVSVFSLLGAEKDFLLSCPGHGFSLQLPKIGIDRHGHRIVAWSENIDGFSKIIARRFSSNGIALGPRIEVSQLMDNSPVDVLLAVSDSGNFCVAWSENNVALQPLYMKRFNENGTPIDDRPILVVSNIETHSPDVAINSKGVCAIVYVDGTTRKSNGKIYPAAGVPENMPTGQTWDDFLYIAMNDDNRLVYCIGNLANEIWHRSGIYRDTGIEWNDAGQETSSSYNYLYHSIDVDMERNGQYTIVWQGPNGSLYGRRYNAYGLVSGMQFTIASTGGASLAPPILDMDLNPAGAMGVVWKNVNNAPPYYDFVNMTMYDATHSEKTPITPLFPIAREEDREIRSFSCALDTSGAGTLAGEIEGWTFLQQFATTGALQGPEVAVNLGSKIVNSAVAFGPKKSKYLAVAWESTADSQIVFVPFKRGEYYSHGKHYKVNSSGSGKNPALSLMNDSVMCVAWEDIRGGETAPSAMVQIYKSGNGSTLVPSFLDKRINDLGLGTQASMPAVASSKQRFFVVWQDIRAENGTTAHIYGQLLSPTGAALSSNIQISAKSGGGRAPAIVSNGNDTFAVAWVRLAGLPLLLSTGFMQRFNASGALVGDTISIEGAKSMAAAMDSIGNTALVWTTITGQVYCRVISKNGSIKIADFRADTGSIPKRTVTVGTNSKGAIILSWYSIRSGLSVCETRTWNANGTFQKEAVVSETPIRIKNPQPAIAVSDTMAMVVWFNSNCLDTTLKDLWGQYTPVLDKSSTASIKGRSEVSPHAGVAIRNPESPSFDLRGRYLGRSPVHKAGLLAPGIYVQRQNRNRRGLRVK